MLCVRNLDNKSPSPFRERAGVRVMPQHYNFVPGRTALTLTLSLKGEGIRENT
jgi:hypothetical protein